MSGGSAEFRPDGPLPTGVTVLQASAGTGKTHTLAGLVTRYVADGVPLPRLLLVTFTRVATSELRDRVRSRLVQEAGAATDAVRAGRLRTALREVDAATITTLHGFCQQALVQLGLAGDADADARLRPDLTELVAEVVDDLHADALARLGADHALIPRGRALTAIAWRVLTDAGVPIVAGGGWEPGGGDPVEARVRFAERVRATVADRLAARRELSYDGLVERLADSLAAGPSGPSGPSAAVAVGALRRRYQVALVDEFQDTDARQWRVLREVFQGHGTLVLIGDPKQAIYAFRGADITAYTGAVRTAASTLHLVESWRSDARYLRALNVLLDGATFGDPAIAYHALTAAPALQEDGLLEADGRPVPPLRLRVLSRPAVGLEPSARGAPVGVVRPVVARDVAGEVVRLLGGGAIVRGGRPGGPSAPRPLRPADVAVLVRTNEEARLVHGTLAAAGVPAVVNGVGSVMATPAAEVWQRLLDAVEHPADPWTARALTVTPLLGWTAERLDAATDDELAAVHEWLAGWAAVLRRGGVPAVRRALDTDVGLGPRLLAQDGGERLVADLDHLAELLHAAATADRLGPAALAAWLRAERASTGDTADEDVARRLESDADAVQVLTVHRSKGLEFGVVLCPFLFQGGGREDEAHALTDPDGRRVVDVRGGEEPPGAAAQRRAEELRLLYVALTRARHRAVVWWAPTWQAGESPLGTVLCCRREDGRVQAAGRAAGTYPDDVLLGKARRLADRSGGTIGVDEVTAVGDPPRVAVHAPAGADDAGLTAARFDRAVDRTWRRTSYSALRADEHLAARSPGQDAAPGIDDEALEDARQSPPVAAQDADGAWAEPVPLAGLAGGSLVGTLVHGVLESVDFTSADLDGALAAAVTEQSRRTGVRLADPPAVAAGLRAAIETPLGPLVGDRRLRDVGPTDRLDELSFELPLAGGDRGAPAPFRVAALADLLDAHLAPDDPVTGYAARLRRLDQPVRGYLTGTIDVVLRHGERALVVDHKTNVLRRGAADAGAGAAPLVPWDYRPAALPAAMAAGDYPLQALLYTVALHRYLRWRRHGYDPDLHLGGVLYLFLRGMTGAGVPRVDGAPCGVFAWRPPTALVIALSDLVDRGAPR